jgi:hypothetical protein
MRRWGSCTRGQVAAHPAKQTEGWRLYEGLERSASLRRGARELDRSAPRCVRIRLASGKLGARHRQPRKLPAQLDAVDSASIGSSGEARARRCRRVSARSRRLAMVLAVNLVPDTKRMIGPKLDAE